MHFRRVKQLGAGDVGLVDLVQLQVRADEMQRMPLFCLLAHWDVGCCVHNAAV